MEDVRNRRNRLLKDVEVCEDRDILEETEVCACLVRSDGESIPPLPTLTQLCTRIILSTILPTSPDDPDDLSWEDMESIYSSGKLDDNHSDPFQLPFPSHLLPTCIPIDICSECSEVVFPVHAQFERMQIVALSRVLLRYVFCSHRCFSKVIERWRVGRKEEAARRSAREDRFLVKDIEV
jgi:hypothetical protein